MATQITLPEFKKQYPPFITSFVSPHSDGYDFERFYTLPKERGFAIYPGKVSEFECFRIGNIGEVYPENINSLLVAIKESMFWKEKKSTQ